eukprot:s3549_g3.t1
MFSSSNRRQKFSGPRRAHCSPLNANHVAHHITYNELVDFLRVHRSHIYGPALDQRLDLCQSSRISVGRDGSELTMVPKKPDKAAAPESAPPVPTKPTLLDEDVDLESDFSGALPDFEIEFARAVSDLSQKNLNSPRSSFYVMDKFKPDQAQKPDRSTHEAYLRQVATVLKVSSHLSSLHISALSTSQLSPHLRTSSGNQEDWRIRWSVVVSPLLESERGVDRNSPTRGPFRRAPRQK